MKISKLKLFYIAQSLAFAYFWISIAIPYLTYRGLSSAESFSLMAIYQFMGVVLEYPTGVIGDKFGYRKVTYIANFLCFASMIIMAFNGGYYLYLFALFLLALGTGFSSGNDMGMLKAVSTNIKKDTANYHSLADLVLFVSAILGGFIGKYSYELALTVSGVLMLLANIPLYLIRNGIVQEKNPDSFTVIVKDGFRVLKQPILRQIFLIIALIGGYSFTIKNVIGSFGNVYGIDVSTIGILIGLGGLTRSIGGKLYAEFEKQNISIWSILLALSIIVMGLFPAYRIVAIVLLLDQLIFGYILAKIDGDIHDLVSDHVRASLFSLKRLIMRLVASGYLAVYGYAIGVGHITLIMYGTGFVILVGTIVSWQYLTRGSTSNAGLQKLV